MCRSETRALSSWNHRSWKYCGILRSVNHSTRSLAPSGLQHPAISERSSRNYCVLCIEDDRRKHPGCFAAFCGVGVFSAAAAAAPAAAALSLILHTDTDALLVVVVVRWFALVVVASRGEARWRITCQAVLQARSESEARHRPDCWSGRARERRGELELWHCARGVSGVLGHVLGRPWVRHKQLLYAIVFNQKE